MSNLVAKENGLEFNVSLPVTQDMLAQVKEQRRLLGEFVSSQLRKDSDYGIIPGTKKATLYKPGAEKLRGLFGLNVKSDCTLSQIDRDKNFAMFSYKASVYRGDNFICECEGSTNSQEQKYKERSVWRQKGNGPGKEQIREVTPIFDVMNTLQKMAQKRAFVGAIILAVGASDFFTQDIDDPEDAKYMGTQAREVTSNQVPSVINVTAQPVNNNQSATLTVKSMASYDDRLAVKEAGFMWNSAKKIWTKEVTRAEYEQGFPFAVEMI